MIVGMPRSFRWLMWGVVVVGSVASFEIWLRALDPGQEMPAVAPRGVEATSEKTVPAIISLSPAATASHQGGGSHAGGGLFGHLPGVTLSGGGVLVIPVASTSSSAARNGPEQGHASASNAEQLLGSSGG